MTGCCFLVRILTGLWASIGVTHSYSSRLFLCALDVYIERKADQQNIIYECPWTSLFGGLEKVTSYCTAIHPVFVNTTNICTMVTQGYCWAAQSSGWWEGDYHCGRHTGTHSLQHVTLFGMYFTYYPLAENGCEMWGVGVGMWMKRLKLIYVLGHCGEGGYAPGIT